MKTYNIIILTFDFIGLIIIYFKYIKNENSK